MSQKSLRGNEALTDPLPEILPGSRATRQGKPESPDVLQPVQSEMLPDFLLKALSLADNLSLVLPAPDPVRACLRASERAGSE